MEEVWRTISNYDYTHYMVSNHGRIKNTQTGNILKPQNSSNGYLQVSVRLKLTDRKNQAYSIHRLVGETFLLPDITRPYINHIDGDKKNNIVSNLEWCTPLENHSHAEKIGLSNHKESLNKANKVRLYKPFGQYTLDGELVAKYDNYNELEEKTGYKRQCVAKCCNGTYKTSHGYTWRFI